MHAVTAAAARRSLGVVGRGLSRRARVPRPPLAWEVTDGPWYDNNLAILELQPGGHALVVDGRRGRRRAARPPGAAAGRDGRRRRLSGGERSGGGAWATSARLMVLGALGVVFGDIGTSPLYAMRTVLGESDHLTTDVVYGMTSTVIWSMVLIVSVLYVGLRGDDRGERRDHQHRDRRPARHDGVELRTEHTSREHSGQIYLPAANWTLALAVLGVVAGFRSSDALSSAYGVAATATITVTAWVREGTGLPAAWTGPRSSSRTTPPHGRGRDVGYHERPEPAPRPGARTGA